MDFHFEPTVVKLSTGETPRTQEGDVLIDIAGGGIRLQIQGLAGLLTLAAFGLIAGVLTQELRKPPELRTWHGRFWGVVPYDLRAPTVERLLRTFWKPEMERFFTDKAFGIGWDLNLAALRRHRAENANRGAAEEPRSSAL